MHRYTHIRGYIHVCTCSCTCPYLSFDLKPFLYLYLNTYVYAFMLPAKSMPSSVSISIPKYSYVCSSVCCFLVSVLACTFCCSRADICYTAEEAFSSLRPRTAATARGVKCLLVHELHTSARKGPVKDFIGKQDSQAAKFIYPRDCHGQLWNASRSSCRTVVDAAAVDERH